MFIKTNIKYLLFGAIVVPILAGCLKKEEYPSEPVIELEGFSTFKNAQGKDSAAVISLSYTDNEGDIGLSQADTVAPFTGQYYYNCYLEYYELQNGVWVKPALVVPFYYRIPPLLDGGSQPVKGTVEIRLSAPFFSPSAYDTIKFSAQLADRALHLSNVVETAPVVVVK